MFSKYQVLPSSGWLSALYSTSEELALHLRCLDASVLIAKSSYPVTRGTASSLPSHLHRTLLVLRQLKVEHSWWKSHEAFSLTHRQKRFLGYRQSTHLPFPCVVTASIPSKFTQVLDGDHLVELVSKYITPAFQSYSKYVIDMHNRDDCYTPLLNQTKDARIR